jgi:dTDP-glucose 4,6-dehydratase
LDTLIVTGGAGFIGSAFCRHLITNTRLRVVNVDKLTYAADLTSLSDVVGSQRYHFVQADVADQRAMRGIFAEFMPDAIVNLAAETHVDRSIDAADDFIRTNINGTFVILEEALSYWRSLPATRASDFRFLHVSTDEVFGSLGPEGSFNESSAYNPSSPYAASKAASDHLARAWGRTYGLPLLLTNCSNNYGPYQFPEKLLPLMILRALHGQPLPVYGRGDNVRDWLFVEDHAHALITVLERGTPGQTYNIGGSAERRNIDMVTEICDLLDELAGTLPTGPRRKLITFVEDRPGHDWRYSIDASKIKKHLDWVPSHDLATGLLKTVRWYLDHEHWWRPHLARSDVLGRKGLPGRVTKVGCQPTISRPHMDLCHAAIAPETADDPISHATDPHQRADTGAVLASSRR